MSKLSKFLIFMAIFTLFYVQLAIATPISIDDPFYFLGIAQSPATYENDDVWNALKKWDNWKKQPLC